MIDRRKKKKVGFKITRNYIERNLHVRITRESNSIQSRGHWSLPNATRTSLLIVNEFETVDKIRNDILYYGQ